MTATTFKERVKRRREHEIVLEARRLIREGGIAELNMDELARAVGVSKPTLYQHFRSKEDLIACVLVNYLQELESHLESTGDAAPLERLKTVLRVMLVQRYGEDGMFAGTTADYETESMSTLLHTHPDVIVEKKRLMAQISLVVEAGKASGEIDPALPTTLVGCLIFRMFGLPGTMQALTETDWLTHPEPRSALFDKVVEVFTRSVAVNS